MLAFTKRFLAWRKTKPALVTGDIRFFDLPEPVLGFERFGAGGEALVCLFNLGTEPVRIRLPMEVRPLDQDLALPGEVDGDLADLPVCAAVFARP